MITASARLTVRVTRHDVSTPSCPDARCRARIVAGSLTVVTMDMTRAALPRTVPRLPRNAVEHVVTDGRLEADAQAPVALRDVSCYRKRGIPRSMS